jgi:hypothetical protein
MDRKNNRSNLSLLEGNIYIGNIYISFFIHPITPHLSHLSHLSHPSHYPILCGMYAHSMKNTEFYIYR